MDISIIIPTFNRAGLLKCALESIGRQTLQPDLFEVLVIDNGSTDNTRAIVEKAIRECPKHNIHYIYEPEPGLLSGRHRGALEAKGDILVFIDDDIEADKGWLQAIKETFDNNQDVKLVGGRSLPKFEIAPPEWVLLFWSEDTPSRILWQLSLLDLGEEVREIDPGYALGLNLSIRRSALFELGGFHPENMPKQLQQFQGDGETGLTMKAKERGCKAVYQPKALVYHKISAKRMTHEYFEKRYYHEGVCDSFTDYRILHGKYKCGDSLKERMKALIRPLILRLLTWTIVNSLIYRKEPQKKKSLKRRFRQAMLDGYNFHRYAVRQDPELLKWVLRDDYWDYKLPQKSGASGEEYQS